MFFWFIVLITTSVLGPLELIAYQQQECGYIQTQIACAKNKQTLDLTIENVFSVEKTQIDLLSQLEQVATVDFSILSFDDIAIEQHTSHFGSKVSSWVQKSSIHFNLFASLPYSARAPPNFLLS